MDLVVLGHLGLLRRTRRFGEGAVFVEEQLVWDQAAGEQQERGAEVPLQEQEQVPQEEGEDDDDDDDEEGFGDEELRGLNIVEELERLAIVH
jgi:hypothetical protein